MHALVHDPREGECLYRVLNPSQLDKVMRGEQCSQALHQQNQNGSEIDGYVFQV
jgi:hypothetical protein